MTDVNIFGIEDPEYYAELLFKTLTPESRRLPYNERPCPDVPGIQSRNVDPPLAQPLQTLLDVIADISLTQRGNVSATTASLKDDNGILKMRLNIVFNHENDKAFGTCRQHLLGLFDMLRQVPYEPPATGGSPKVISDALKDTLIQFSLAIHNFSFDAFEYRVNKRKGNLSAIRGYVDCGVRFGPEDRHTLLEFLFHVDLIIKGVAKAQPSKQLSTNFMRMLLSIYSFWKKHDLLSEDPLSHSKTTLLYHADLWLGAVHKIDFELQRYAVKIMSFMISANRLFTLTQSRRLRKVIQGEFSVKVLPSPTTAPYRCNISRETVKEALDTVLAETEYLSADYDDQRESFINNILKQEIVVHRKPTVHAELAMIMAMDNGEINDVIPYIGVSKLSCVMCSHYIYAFNKVTRQMISTKGSPGKLYTGWFWPSLPGRDGELRPAFLGQTRAHLLSDFKLHVKTCTQLSDSAPELETASTWDEIRELGKEFEN